MSKLQTGTFNLIHVIDLELYAKIIEDIEVKIKNYMSNKDPLYPLLSHEISNLQNLLTRLKPKPRKQRSLDFIGSAWKWVAGNPDHADFQIIESRMNNLLINNDRQIVINKLTNERINQITNVTNDIVNAIKKSSSLRDEYFINIKYKLDILKEELTNVNYALHWAKASVVNSFILSNSEINLAKETFERNEIPYLNLEEAFEFADVKIATNVSTLLYIISIPVTQLESCRNIMVKPIKRKNIVTKISFNYILQCNNQIYGIKEKCKTYNNLTICKRNQIVDISKNECIPNLLWSRQTNCTEINNQHIPSVEEILPGTLLLNQYNGSILVNSDAINLTGSFIIQYHNVSITINKQNYVSHEIPGSKPLPAIIQPDSHVKKYEELLTLEMMKELHLKNTKYIEQIKGEDNLRLVTNSSLITIITVVIVVIVIRMLILQKKRQINITTNLDPMPTTPTPKIRSVGKEAPEIHTKNPVSLQEQPVTPKPTRISQIPFF